MKKWTKISYNINNVNLTKQLVSTYIKSFGTEVLNNLQDNQFILLLIVVEYKNKIFKSLGNASKINKKRIKLLM